MGLSLVKPKFAQKDVTLIEAGVDRFMVLASIVDPSNLTLQRLFGSLLVVVDIIENVRPRLRSPQAQKLDERCVPVRG